MAAQKFLISKSNEKLIGALRAFQDKTVRDKVIKHMIAHAGLTHEQKFQFIDVARDAWAEQDREAMFQKKMNEAHARMLKALKTLEVEPKTASKATKCESVQDLIRAMNIR